MARSKSVSLGSSSTPMSYAWFLKVMEGSKREILLEALEHNRKSIRVKKEKTALKNLERITSAVLEVSQEKGFQAMSMRDLSAASGLSMGALYSYFSSKEELLKLLVQLGGWPTAPLLERFIALESDAASKLRAAIRTHIYLSEILRPWFYFLFMEARNLSDKETREVQSIELYTEKLLIDILSEGIEAGVFIERDVKMTASIIKAMQQDWYLKRWKYAQRKTKVDEFADSVIDFVQAFLLK